MAKKKKNDMFLFSDVKDTNSIKLKRVVRVHKHTKKDIERNLNKMIDFMSYHITKPRTVQYTVGQHIHFKLNDDSKTYNLPMGVFMYNYIMWAPYIIINGELTEDKIFYPKDLTNSFIVDYIDRSIYELRDKTTYFELCELIQFQKTMMNKICKVLGEKIMMSLNLHEFIKLMDDEDAREILTCSFDIPSKTSPSKLEKLIDRHTSNLMDYISSREDLNISTYVKNGLFVKGQFREFAAHMAHKPTLSGSTLPFTNNTNLLMGLRDLSAFVIDAFGTRKAEVLKLNVSDAGDFERTLNALIANVRFVDEDYVCDSRHFVEKSFDSMKRAKDNDGRVFTLDPESDDFYILNPNDPTHDKFLGRPLYMKSPITCTHPLKHKGYICKACYGYNLAAINNDIHIGRLSSLDSSDETQQKLLGGKHSLITVTEEIKFTDNFSQYFRIKHSEIILNDELYEGLAEGTAYDSLSFEFIDVKKSKDGSGQKYDRSVDTIVIHNSDDDTRVIISEENGRDIFLSVDLAMLYEKALSKSMDPVIRIPFKDFFEDDIDIVLFDLNFKNNDLAEPLFELKGILSKGDTINQYKTYTQLLNTLMPLFNQSGINIPDIHIEMIIGQLIFDRDGKRVDWNNKDVEYGFKSLNKSVLNMDSVWHSLIFKETVKQLTGSYRSYEKSEPSIYDVFISEE